MELHLTRNLDVAYVQFIACLRNFLSEGDAFDFSFEDLRELSIQAHHHRYFRDPMTGIRFSEAERNVILIDIRALCEMSRWKRDERRVDWVFDRIDHCIFSAELVISFNAGALVDHGDFSVELAGVFECGLLLVRAIAGPKHT